MDASEAEKLRDRAYRKLVDRRNDVERLDAYAAGDQPLAFASKEWAEFHQGRYVGFSDNWCAPVASAPAERIRLTGISQKKAGKRALGQLWDDWQGNDGDAQSSQGFLQSIIAKRSYTIVWGNDDEEPEFTWEHPSQVIVIYDPSNPRKKIAALKAWMDDDHEYATLYTADELWKWRRGVGVKIKDGRTASGLHITTNAAALSLGDAWDDFQPSDDDAWPLDNPLGEVNVVEWPNRPRLGNEPLSDIQGTKAMQDAINLLWAYLFGAADHASMPGRVIMGQEPPKLPILDADGQKIGEKVVDIKELQQGRFLWLTGQNAKIDQFDAAKLDVFTDVIEIGVSHVAAQTRTPSHYLINADNVPAAGYELAEAGLVNKVREFELFSNAPVREHFRLMALVRGDKKTAAALRTADPNWANAETRSDAQLSDALLKKRQIGYPFKHILKLDGLSPTEIEEVMDQVREEQQDPYLSKLNAKDAANADAEPTADGE